MIWLIIDWLLPPSPLSGHSQKASPHPSCGWVKAVLVLFNDIEESSFSTVTLASAAIAGELARHAHNNFAGSSAWLAGR